MTGTPIQNRLDDLGALVQFLRVPLLETSSQFRYYITSPIESGDALGFLRLRQLLKSLCLRRTNHLLQLPEPFTLSHRLDLSTGEDAQYASIGETYRQAIDKAVSGQEVPEAYNSVLKAILRLRLLCNHGTYELPAEASRSASPDDQDEALTLLQQSDGAICATCACDVSSVRRLNDDESGVFTVCGHLLCRECVQEYENRLREAKQGKKFQCPLCQELIGGNFLASKQKGRRQMKSKLSPSVGPQTVSISFNINSGYSSKLKMLLEDIESHMHKDKRYTSCMLLQYPRSHV